MVGGRSPEGTEYITCAAICKLCVYIYIHVVVVVVVPIRNMHMLDVISAR